MTDDGLNDLTGVTTYRMLNTNLNCSRACSKGYLTSNTTILELSF